MEIDRMSSSALTMKKIRNNGVSSSDQSALIPALDSSTLYSRLNLTKIEVNITPRENGKETEVKKLQTKERIQSPPLSPILQVSPKKKNQQT